MSRRGDNIHKRKDGRWEGRYISSRDEFGKAKYSSFYSLVISFHNLIRTRNYPFPLP